MVELTVQERGKDARNDLNQKLGNLLVSFSSIQTNLVRVRIGLKVECLAAKPSGDMPGPGCLAGSA